jgi:hypothetical protein
VKQAYQYKIQAVSNFGTDVSSNFFGCREMAKKIKTMSILVNGHTSRGKENVDKRQREGGVGLCAPQPRHSQIFERPHSVVKAVLFPNDIPFCLLLGP